MSAVLLNSNSGANINQIIELAKKLNIEGVMLSDEEIEEIEDRRLLRRMNESLASGLADREEMFRLLGR
jgi:hypothetical protein